MTNTKCLYTYVYSVFSSLQHGKNFHRILKFMQTKYRKKNDPVIPNLNKDQVHVYIQVFLLTEYVHCRCTVAGFHLGEGAKGGILPPPPL